jgi:hypothetical protein
MIMTFVPMTHKDIGAPRAWGRALQDEWLVGSARAGAKYEAGRETPPTGKGLCCKWVSVEGRLVMVWEKTGTGNVAVGMKQK